MSSRRQFLSSSLSSAALFSLAVGGGEKLLGHRDSWMFSDEKDAAGLAVRIRNYEDLIARESQLQSSGWEADAVALQKDAETAWQYFDNWSKRSHGMVPGTSYIDDGKLQGYPLVTMWDVATYINAFISARLLGLISAAAFEGAAEKIIALLNNSSFEFAGGRLPKIEIAVGSLPADRNGFDSADTGRLLISLKILSNMLGGEKDIGDLVSKWNFSKVIKNGTLLNVDENRSSKFPLNSYSHYAVQGYRLWGIAVDDIYERAATGFDLVAKQKLYQEVAQRGRIATEPNTTRLIEIGDDVATDFLCNMLLAAQIKRFESVGKLTCVSEGILDETPWFTYQACQFSNSDEEKWAIDTNSTKNSIIVATKGNRLRTVSPKGCFMWHAVRPGQYSKQLLAFTRENARTENIGFASNIYESSQKATYCSDVNTNGHILEALTYIKFNRSSLLEISAQFGYSSDNSKR